MPENQPGDEHTNWWSQRYIIDNPDNLHQATIFDNPPRCEVCGSTTDLIPTVWYQYVCEACFALDTDSCRCIYCGCIYTPEYRGSHSGCCDICAPMGEENDTVLHDWSYKPIPIFHFINDTKYKENTKLYFGIELELELNKADVKQLHGIVKPFNNKETHFYFKYDGSLQNGIEIVSHPMSYAYLRNYSSLWNRAIAAANKLGCISKLTNRCGMHIHMSLEAWSRLQIYKLLKLFRENEDFILHITKRTLNQLNKWAYIDGPRESVKKSKAKAQLGLDRHSAINLTDTTLEIRIFNGTLNQDEFWRNIEIVKCLYDFTLNYSIKSMNANVLYNYVSKNSNQYPLFYKSLGGKKINVHRNSQAAPRSIVQKRIERSIPL